MKETGLDRPIRTGVIGCGYFGSLHARRYARYADLVGVVDTDFERAKSIADELKAEPFGDHRELIGKVDAVSIAVPAHFHYGIARDFLQAGVHVLVEKPMTDNLDHANDLIVLAKKAGVTLQVGLIENFSSTFRALKKVVNRPLYVESVRIAPWKPRASDVDVVLDMMIHDIDVILGMVPSKVASVDAVGTPVLTRHEDIANARLLFENGSVASAVASRVAIRSERKMRIFQPNTYTHCDFSAGTIFQVHRSGDIETEGLAALRQESWNVDKEDSLDNEITEFLHCVRTGQTPTVDGRRGSEALRVAMMIKASARDHHALVERHLAGEAARRTAETDVRSEGEEPDGGASP